MRGEDIEFGIELDEEVGLEEEGQKYFDGETVFKTLSFDCCREEEDDSDKVSYYVIKKQMYFYWSKLLFDCSSDIVITLEHCEAIFVWLSD